MLGLVLPLGSPGAVLAHWDMDHLADPSMAPALVVISAPLVGRISAPVDLKTATATTIDRHKEGKSHLKSGHRRPQPEGSPQILAGKGLGVAVLEICSHGNKIGPSLKGLGLLLHLSPPLETFLLIPLPQGRNGGSDPLGLGALLPSVGCLEIPLPQTLDHLFLVALVSCPPCVIPVKFQIVQFPLGLLQIPVGLF